MNDATRPLAYKPPSDDAFMGADFLESEPLQDLALELIEKFGPELGFILDWDLKVLWKKSGGEKGRRATLGKCTKPSGLTRFFSRADWVIWLAADNLREMEVTAQDIEAVLFHELLHCDMKGDPAVPAVKGHDIECFAREVQEYGLWKRDLRDVGKVMAEQLRLEGL